MKATFTFLFIGTILLCGACRYKGPENLPALKKEFKEQIGKFEKQKIKTDTKVEESVQKLTVFEQTLKDAENADKEFKKVYAEWHKVDKNIKGLNKQYNKLKDDADNLFTAMQDQTNSLSDEKNKADLTNALNTSRTDYDATLAKTEVAINNLNKLHLEAIDVVKALEVAVAIGQIADIQTSLKSIEDRVQTIMSDLNTTIQESKDLYEQRMGGLKG